MTTRLPLLTNSSITTFRRCPREYYFKYVLFRRSLGKSAALMFGTLFHLGLNAWWAAPSDKFDAAIGALRASVDVDPFELVKAECLIAGYTARWNDGAYETLAVERKFRLPLNFTSEGVDDIGFDSGGAIDAICVSPADRVVHNVEHKTTSSDISTGSDYWRHVVTLDPQVSTYEAAAKALGYAPRDTIYDVIRKPEIQPLKATPEEARKYTIPTKKEPTPRLYKGHRETEETLEEYRERLTADIAERPHFYFARATIVRLESEHVAHHEDVIATARMIRFATEVDMWPRTPSACERYHRLCEFHPVCSGETNIDDETRYEAKSHAHEELGDV